MEAITEMKALITRICEEKMNMEVKPDVNPKEPIAQEFTLDSISLFELIVNLEEEFQFKVADDDIDKVGKMNIEELHEFIQKQQPIHG
ncbi:acyl carrier protein [Paenibacillus chitinolyticus]|uniref:acyl carrier protein n=1 Tax=Paenibacillus chitinolyticus TaxID=79263 RepID=UPI002DBC5688|nr:phosphopantetheine-binding protein [Paenibacillus chitinolyticus]MEC0244266.1 phosphopantetheine-binding protein [Paenibacillus chitinolyticus]